MCDPVCEYRFRSCHTIYFILAIDDIGYWTIPSFVEPFTLRHLSGRALSWCRRTSVRPPHEVCRTPCHCQATLLSKLLQSSLNLLAFSLRRHFFQRGLSAISYPENMEKQRASYPKNAGDYPMRIHHLRDVTVAVLMQPVA